MAASSRNITIDICKGIAIILMVLGHCETPKCLVSWLYLFHMPIFFMAAGYFFTRKNLDEPWKFVTKRFKGLYVPFLKWSIFFLLIHNLLFEVDILNEQYGNWEGGVTHPYSWQQGCQRLVNIVFSMGGYDEFLAGAFWFFRALLITSILFLALYLLLDRNVKWLRGNRAVAVIGLAALGFAAFKIFNGLKVVTVVQGGIRECWGMFFFAAGVLFRRFERYLAGRWWLALLCLAITVVGACEKWAGMNLSPKMQDVLTLPLTGVAGFIMVHYAAGLIARYAHPGATLLAHCGKMSLYVYIFHISAFKVVSLIKIWYYDLDFAQVGSHMIIHDHLDDLFWIPYTIVGVTLPLLWMAGYNRIKRFFTERRQAKTEKTLQ